MYLIRSIKHLTIRSEYFKAMKIQIKSVCSTLYLMETRLRFCRFSASIEDTLREICLIEMVGTTLIMCLLEYSLITVTKYYIYYKYTEQRIIQNCTTSSMRGFLRDSAYTINRYYLIFAGME